MNSRKLIAIDPGDKHAGIAWFEDDQCVMAGELDPDVCLDYLVAALKGEEFKRAPFGGQIPTDPDVLVVEEYRLYPWRTQAQGFSIMSTAEMIGQIKLVYRLFAQEGVLLVMQGSSILKPTAKIAAARGIQSKARELGAGPHARSAELHGVYAIEQHNIGKGF